MQMLRFSATAADWCSKNVMIAYKSAPMTAECSTMTKPVLPLLDCLIVVLDYNLHDWEKINKNKIEHCGANIIQLTSTQIHDPSWHPVMQRCRPINAGRYNCYWPKNLKSWNNAINMWDDLPTCWMNCNAYITTTIRTNTPSNATNSFGRMHLLIATWFCMTWFLERYNSRWHVTVCAFRPHVFAYYTNGSPNWTLCESNFWKLKTHALMQQIMCQKTGLIHAPKLNKLCEKY